MAELGLQKSEWLNLDWSGVEKLMQTGIDFLLGPRVPDKAIRSYRSPRFRFPKGVFDDRWL
jgi:hypothetical protein